MLSVSILDIKTDEKLKKLDTSITKPVQKILKIDFNRFKK